MQRSWVMAVIVASGLLAQTPPPEPLPYGVAVAEAGGEAVAAVEPAAGVLAAGVALAPAAALGEAAPGDGGGVITGVGVVGGILPSNASFTCCNMAWARPIAAATSSVPGRPVDWIAWRIRPVRKQIVVSMNC